MPESGPPEVTAMAIAQLVLFLAIAATGAALLMSRSSRNWFKRR
jgi:hypothetical protein